MISAGEKFALIALPRANVAESVTTISLNSYLWVMRCLPFEVADHWQRWIGEIRTKDLQVTGLFLLAKDRSQTPQRDSDNDQLMRRICYLFDALLIAQTPACPVTPFLLAGANADGDVSIRRISDLQRPVWCAFKQLAILKQIDDQTLRIAAKLAAAITVINETADYVRFKRAISAFFVGIHQGRWDERLHQFCRCIDGIILSRQGKGEADFTARTVFFIGGGHSEVTRQMYRMRSAVEHLRPAETEASDKRTLREQRLCVIERALQAETIARHALQ